MDVESCILNTAFAPDVLKGFREAKTDGGKVVPGGTSKF
jgi:hypothetical protein